jgi:gamma-glutamylcyclotransferase (GGCT)/AIG2-like uncharacterized protein YtfP
LHRLFCYGTLQVPQVIRAVTGRDHSGKKAVLREYAIHRVRNAEYPGITYSAGSLTEGILYGNIGDAELNTLDLFEGELYDRQLLEVQVPDRTVEKAWVYVIARQHLGVLSQERWKLADFLDKGLEHFMKGYVHGRRDIYAKS